MTKIKRILEIIKSEGFFVTKLNHYELIELSIKGYKCQAVAGGKYSVEKIN